MALLISASLPLQSLSGQGALPDFEIEWRWADFDRTTGFPGGTVLEMAEVGDTIWVRTRDQVLWWAGFDWQRAGPEQGIPDGPATSIAPSGEGGILVVAGGGVYTGGGGGFEPIRVPEFEDGWRAYRAVPFRSGILVTARRNANAVFLVVGDSVQNVTPGSGLENPGNLWLTAGGGVWLNSGSTLLTFGEGGWEERGLPTAETHRVSAFWEDSEGRGFVFKIAPLPDRGLWSWNPGEPMHRVSSEGMNAALSGTISPDGTVYVVFETGDIRARVAGDWEEIHLPPARSDGVHRVYADRSGNLWFASARGLHLYRRSLERWSTIRRPFPDARNRVNEILLSREGETWLGTGDGLVRPGVDGPGVWVGRIHGLPLGVVTGLAQDSAGVIWVTSGASFEGAFRFENGEWTRLGPDEGLDVGLIHRVQVSGDGAVWLLSLGRPGTGESAGVYRFRNGAVEQWVDPGGWLDDRAYAFAEGRDGTRWFGTGKGLARWQDGQWSFWGPEDGIGTNGFHRVFTVLPDTLGGAWVGYGPGSEAGLGLLNPDGSIVHMTVGEGLPGNSINEIEQDASGVIWVTTDTGIGRFSQGSWTVLDGSAGLNPSRVWPLEFGDRIVVFGTVGGGVQILSRSEEENPPPQVRLIGPITVEGGSVRVSWRATSYKGEVAPSRVLTRDRFDEGEWSSWETYRNLWTTDADSLSWGRHRVEIQAKGLHGQLSEPLVAEFTIPYPIFLRAVFYLPVGGLGLALAVLLVLVRRRRMRADRILRASEQRLRILVDSAPEAIAIYDVDQDRFVDANRNTLEMFGVAPEEAGLSPLAAYYPEFQPDGQPTNDVAREMVEGALRGEEPVLEVTCRMKGGEEFPAEIRTVNLPSEGRRLIRFSMTDLREKWEVERQKTELEDQLRQAQKLEAVGQLTGGVAHDFNNLLTVIMGNLELLQATRGSDPEVEARVKGSMEAAERSALLTQRLLAFSRRQALNPQPVQVAGMVEGMMDLLVRSLGETIQIETRFEPGLWLAVADLGQLEHALINLAVNARDAMLHGGRLHIEGSNVVVEADVAEALEVETGDFVVLSVTDTGTGMDPGTQSRAFDPFFTTKEVGKGSGLGLSMVYGFLKQLGGFVKIYSEEGEGTTVRLFLPRAEDTDDEKNRSPKEPSMPRGNGEHILVVEDEPRLLQLAVLLCERLDYRPVAAPDGSSAMEVINGDSPLDLLFTDVVLPGGMNGVELAEAARELRPGLKVLFTSGYAEQAVLGTARTRSDFEMLSKPYDRGTLARKLHAVLTR